MRLLGATCDPKGATRGIHVAWNKTLIYNSQGMLGDDAKLCLSFIIVILSSS